MERRISDGSKIIIRFVITMSTLNTWLPWFINIYDISCYLQTISAEFRADNCLEHNMLIDWFLVVKQLYIQFCLSVCLSVCSSQIFVPNSKIYSVHFVSILRLYQTQPKRKTTILEISHHSYDSSGGLTLKLLSTPTHHPPKFCRPLLGMIGVWYFVGWLNSQI